MRIYGICGGPSGTSATQCMVPGGALCEVCPDQASLAEEDGGLGVQCSAPQYDGSFWVNAPNNVQNCCAALLTQRDSFVPVDGEPNFYAARNAWLYDNFITCTGIRTIYPVP